VHVVVNGKWRVQKARNDHVDEAEAGNPMSGYRVGYIVGSLSAKSINRTLAKALIKLAPENLKFVEIPIRELPLYNYDFDTDYPPQGRALKDAIAAVDAVLFVTPEYNRGIPGGLKNAIDWASRPYGTNSFAHKPSAVIGASPGKIGTAVGQQSLRSVLSFCNSPSMEAPEGYLHFTPGLITELGEVTDKGTEQFLRDFIEAFEVFVARVHTVLTPDSRAS
jgi:chromate reductase, NAD(P)H dehydrogenase (quinone)